MRLQLYNIECVQLYTGVNTRTTVNLSSSDWFSYRVHMDPGAMMDFR
jgi:hypothetical protein